MSFYRPVPPNPYHWNRVIPGVITDAMTYDEMIAHAMWKMDEIINYLVHSVPYLIDVELNANSDSCTLTGFLYDDYQKKEFNHTFTAGGSADGTYYVNYRSAGPDVQPISETTDPIFVSQEYMPMNCTTLYSFTITGEKIDPVSVQFNDLYTGMHNADPNAHKALFDAVYAKIDAEIAEVNEALAAETTARQAADTQLQNNIDAEATAREQADTQLQNNIDAEETAREQADTNLQGQITANDNDIGALTTRVATAESDITALEGQMGTAETNITDLQTRMGKAETNIGNNTSAISNEAATRQSEDEALATQISTETQQRKQQDSQLNTSISANTQAIAALNAGTGTVKSVNTLTGDVTLAAGNNVTITPSGKTLTIAATGGTAGVSSVNNVTGDVNLVAGSNVSITPSGQNITIAATGGGSAGVSGISVNSGAPITGSVGLLNGNGINLSASGKNITVNNTGVRSLGVTGSTAITGQITLQPDTTINLGTNPAQQLISVGLSTPMKFQTANALGVYTGTNGFASPVSRFNRITMRVQGEDIMVDFPGKCCATVMGSGKGNFASSAGYATTVAFNGPKYDGLYIAFVDTQSGQVRAYHAGENITGLTSTQVLPFAYIWISTDSTGNLIDWSYELIGAKVPEEPKSTMGTVWYYDPATSQDKTANIFIQRVDNAYIIPPFTFNQAIPTTASSSGVSKFLQFSAPLSKSVNFTVPNAGLVTIYEGLENDMGITTTAAYMLNVSVSRVDVLGEGMFELSLYAGTAAAQKNGFSFSGCVIVV